MANTARIHCNTTFLDGVDRFEAGDVRSLDAERAARLIASGWASPADAPTSSAPADQSAADLTIKSAKHAQGAKHG